MSESVQIQGHVADAVLWQWRKQELDVAASTAVQQHLQSCGSCQLRAQALSRLLEEMPSSHHAIQPTLVEQMHLLRALEARFTPPAKSPALVDISHSLVRWLAPAIAILAAVFMLGREEATSTSGVLSQTREAQLLITADDEDLQQTLLELALSSEENSR
ncbi:hypothetical protein HUU05_21915 [candidate division KSB1 bacterium]|nr:hypothetical protein [candidate division KSB1 bacterium]